MRHSLVRGSMRRSGAATATMALVMIGLLWPQWAAAVGLDPYRGAEVAYETPLESSRSHIVPVDRIARVEGFMQPRTSRQVQGRLRSITWRHPRGVSPDAVFEHLRRQLPDDAWYECQSRDCGPSTYWAHRHFGVADLYGADGSQSYVAVPRATPQGPVLTMLYVVQRGTREVMAHVVDILLDQDEVVSADPEVLARTLAETGVARVPVAFAEDGALAEDAGAMLDALGEAAAGLAPDLELWFVVHLRDPGRGGRATLAASQQRADALVRALDARLSERTVSGLGVGALIPGVLRDEGVLVQLVVQQPGG